MLLYNPWLLRWQSVCLQCGRPGFYPWVRKIPWERKWQPISVLLPGKSRGQRILVGYSPWGCKESDMTERLHFHFIQCLYFSFTYFILYGTLCRALGLCSSLYEATRSGFHCLSSPHLLLFISSVKLSACSPSRITTPSPLSGGRRLQLLSVLGPLFSRGPD